MQAVVKAILSFMLTSWTYSEIMLVCPEIEPFTKKIIASLTVPTHDKWQVYYDKEHRAKVTEDLNGFLANLGLNVEPDQSNDAEQLNDSDQSNDFRQYLEIPQNLRIHINEPNHVSIFENSDLPKMLYERF